MRKFKDILTRCMPRFDGDSDGGGSALETIKKVGVEVGKVAETVKTATEGVEINKAKTEEIAAELATLKSDSDKDIKRLAAQAAGVQSALARNLGKSGADDWLNDMGKFLRGVYASKRGAAVSDTDEIKGKTVKDLMAKAAADFTTTTDATAGFLLPDVLMPGITELQDIYGNFYPMVTKVRQAPGQALLMNRDAARPVASWRTTQLTGITEEATPMSFAQDSLVSILLGTHIQIANELLQNPTANFSAVSTVRLLHAILRKLEFGLIAGTTGAGEPSDGLIADATDQGTIATMTFANLVTFLQRCIADNEYAFDPTRNKIIITPTDAMTLATEAVGASELTGMLVWGNPRAGIPTTLLGYELVVHPAANNGSSKHVLLGDPSMITLVEDGAPTVDISMHAANAFTENASILRAFNHYDWNIGQPSEWHKTVVTA